MKILQVVTLLSPDGAYGGPLRVAMNQARALTSLGHEVTIAAGVRGYAGAHPKADGFHDLKLFPAHFLTPQRRFAAISAPSLISFVRRTSRYFDVVHVHMARDLITLPAAIALRSSPTPFILQCHGMIGISSRVSARFVDFFVRRSLTAAARVLYLTEDERQSLEAISNYGASLTLLLNGVPQTEAMPAPSVPEVLFLARLQERKRPVAFVEMARTLLDDGAKATFTLVGPDEGEGDAVRLAIRASGHSKSIVWEGSLPPADTLGRMSSASIYVLPSVNEIVPMSVLEAMSLARAVVITDSNGLAPIVRAAHAGVVVDTSQESLVDGVRQLLSSPQLAAQLAHNAHELITRDFSIESIARVLEEIYLQSIEPKSR